MRRTRGSKRVLAMRISVAAVTVLLGAALLLFAMRELKPELAGPHLHTLVVTGTLHHVTPQQVHKVISASLTAGFFAVDMNAVQQEVVSLPWVARADVRRAWPGTLYVTITEQVPVAVWNGNGLINADGVVFTTGTDIGTGKLPQLEGPPNTAPAVLAEFRRVTAVLNGPGIVVTRLQMDARGAWNLRLKNDIKVRLGRTETDTRLHRFNNVVIPVLKPRIADVAYVDMRYTSGFAVGWKQQTADGA